MASLFFFLSSDPDEPKHTPHKQQIHMLSPAKTLNQTSHPLSVVSLSPLCLPLHSLLDHPTVVCCSAGPAEEATPTPKLLSPFSLSHANTHRVKVRREYRRGPFPSISVHSPNNHPQRRRTVSDALCAIAHKKKKNCTKEENKKREDECRWGGGWRGDRDDDRMRGREKCVWEGKKNTHCGMAGLKDAHVGCCSRSPASAAACPGCAVHRREPAQEGGGEVGQSEGGWGWWCKKLSIIQEPAALHVTADTVYYSSGLFRDRPRPETPRWPDVIVPAHPRDLHWSNHDTRIIATVCPH